VAKASRIWEVGASVVLCHLSTTPAPCTCCSHGPHARWSGLGQGTDEPGGLHTVSLRIAEGVAAPRRLCPQFPRLGLRVGPGVQGQSKPGHHLPLKHPQAYRLLGTAELRFSCSR
jgi:hypothetical protein